MNDDGETIKMAIILFFFIVMISTCSTCQNTGRIDESLNSVESKMDTLIKHQHITDIILISKLNKN